MSAVDPDDIGLDLSSFPLFTEPTGKDVQASPRRSAAAGHLAAAIGSAQTMTAEAPTVTEPAPASRDRQERTSPFPDPGTSTEGVDWLLVAAFRQDISKRMSSAMTADGFDAQTSDKELGRTMIQQVIREHVDTLVRGGETAWDQQTEDRMTKALFDSIYGLGRIQSLVDDPRVENVEIYGDVVHVDYGGGDVVRMPPVADSDEQLISDIQFIAGGGGERGRSFSAGTPILSMTLPGGERLEALHPPISPRPLIVIRRHPIVATRLMDLVSWGTLTPDMAEFLSAVVKAGMSIVVSGHQGAGKTTLVRSLAHVLPPHEPIVTIENERELHLDKSGLHDRIRPLEARPGQGEASQDGRKTGEITLEDLLVSSLRLNTHRVIVGEVRGDEVVAMFKAMQAGAGSMSTLHANSPTDAIERLATLLQQGMQTSPSFAYRQIGQHIDFIVQISNQVDGTRTRERFISDISQVLPGEGDRPSVLPIFKTSSGSTKAQCENLPRIQELARLEAVGFDGNRLRPNLGEGA